MPGRFGGYGRAVLDLLLAHGKAGIRSGPGDTSHMATRFPEAGAAPIDRDGVIADCEERKWQT